MNLKKMVLMLLVMVLLVGPSMGFAASPWLSGETYGDRISGKMQFGLKNVLLGWVDLFYEPNKAANEKTNVWAGAGKGLVDTVMNIGGGAFHLVTFPIPVDFPLPDNGVQLS